MRRKHLALLSGGLALLAGSSCSPASDGPSASEAAGVGGGGPAFGLAQPMYVEGCSLGCSSGAHGAPVDCTTTSVAQNEEIVVRFTRHVDLLSVDPQSFRVRKLSDGTPAPGSFVLRPEDARVLVFRPTLSFDPLGNPIFGLELGQTYEVATNGTTSSDPPPYVRSIEGRANLSRVDCAVLANGGVLDYAPGAPTASLFVDLVDANGDIVPDQPGEGAVDVSVETALELVFDDVMNLATVVQPGTGLAPFLAVQLDLDGDPMTAADQVPIEGTWTVAVGFDPPQTRAVFTPEEPLPPAGSGAQPRQVVVVMPPAISDLVGNPLANAGQVVFTPEAIDYPQISLPRPGGEPFLGSGNEDPRSSGAAWGSGQLTYGLGGGSGRLGTLRVGAGDLLEFATDSASFPLPGRPHELLTNRVPDPVLPNGYDPLDPDSWPTVTITDGNFEFGALGVEDGGLLALAGAEPARLFSRGDLEVEGLVDVAGGAAPDHLSNSGGEFFDGQLTAFGGPGGAAGPAGGAGGAGADRFNHGDSGAAGCATVPLLNAGGIEFSPSPAQNPGTDNDGRAGLGVGGESGTGAGSGRGGLHWPPSPPRTLVPTLQPCFGDSEFVIVALPSNQFQCRIAMVGGAGSGGAYALDGVEGMAFSPFAAGPSQPGLLPLTPGPTPGGDAARVGLEPPGTFPPLLRDLSWHAGELLGGAGGGGGGLSVWGTKTVVDPASPGADCFSLANVFPYFDHSAAGGGGAGGATQLVSGRALRVTGRVDGAGGTGGSSLDPSGEIADCTNSRGNPDCGGFAAPGGGGAGGACKLQGASVELGAGAGRLSVAGGAGGVGAGGSIGGDGSPGLVRVESATGTPDPANLAPSIEPYLPGDVQFNLPYASAAILSVGDFEPSVQRPDSQSASSSCWMQPDLAFYQLEFVADGVDPTDPLTKGWNMDVMYQTPNGVKLFPWRGISTDPDFPFVNTSFEDHFGNLVNSELPAGMGSLVAVRFQGARSAGALETPCQVDLSDAGGDVEPGSVTPFVPHPWFLNQFEPQPDMVRFTVVFDRSLISSDPIAQNVVGITNLRVEVVPD